MGVEPKSPYCKNIYELLMNPDGVFALKPKKNETQEKFANWT